MNDAPESELILRRLSDPFPVGPGEYAHVLWLVTLGLILAVGLFYVVAMYLRDSRTAKWWAIPLGVLRVCVYFLLAWGFLLPAIQKWETVEKRSRVVVVLDVSPSLTNYSDDNSSVPGVKPKTRMEKVLDFLTDDQVKFMDRLLEKNPVQLYRFGSRLDEEGSIIDRGQSAWSKEDWDAWVRYDFKPWALRGVSPAGRELVRKSAAWGDGPGNAEWAIGWAKLTDADAIPAGLTPEDQQALKDNRGRLEKRVDVARALALGTNVPDSLTSVVNREAANMVQAVVVFTDGRSNLGSESAYRTLRDRATREKIPVFTVAVGEARENIEIRITDVQAPDRAPPDEQFKVSVEADGVGLGNAEVDVTLDVFQPGRDPKKDAPDHTLPAKKLKFQGDTSPPHGQVEFVIDPEGADFPEELTEKSEKLGRRRQLKQGAWSFVAKIPKDKREVFAGTHHASVPPRVVQVIDKPLRVLLFASAATREYQTLRTLLSREVQQNRAELSICLQNEGGREGTTNQDVPPERLLTKFPTRLDTTDKATDKPEDKYYNLNQYDLVVAFDPDWTELSADQVKNLQTWVDNLGGGLIYVAAPLNTFQLARADETGRLKPLLDILPVVMEDVILIKTRPLARLPRRLILKPNPEFDVLKLEEDIVEDPVGGWERYFTGNEKYLPSPDKRGDLNPMRGFYEYYPVKVTKPGSTTLAELMDVDEKGDPAMRPWLVTTQPARGRTAFLASGEIWRLRQVQPGGTDYYDRFWVKLSRYVAANRDVKASRGRILMNKEFVSGAQVRVQARMLAPNGQPYDPNVLNLKFRVEQWNAAADKKEKEFGPYELKPKKGGGEFDGYYAGQVLAEPSRFPPGDSRYRVVVDVPDSVGDTIQSEFTVKQSDPELDNTRPDFAALEQAASTLEEVKGRVKKPEVLEKLRGGERNDASVKLAFKLADREKVSAIPDCIDQMSNSARNRGAVDDLWDEGPVVTMGARRIEVGWLLLGAVALLSMEWLIRKLLRMA